MVAKAGCKEAEQFADSKLINFQNEDKSNFFTKI